MPDDPFSHRAEHKPLPAGFTLGRYNDDVGLFLRSQRHNLMCRSAKDHKRTGFDFGRQLFTPDFFEGIFRRSFQLFQDSRNMKAGRRDTTMHGRQGRDHMHQQHLC